MTVVNLIKNKTMKNSDVLKGLSIEELQVRNEFTAIVEEDSGCCASKCDITVGDVGL